MWRAVLQNSVTALPWRVRKRIKNLPVVAPFQRWLVTRFMDGRSFLYRINAGPAAGLLYPLTFPQDKRIWTGTYEVDLAEALVRSLRPGFVCYDIGGYRGFFSGVMALRGAQVVHTFEPFEANCTQIRAMHRENPALPIVLHHSALGDQAGKMEFIVMSDASMGKLEASTFDVAAHASGRLSVDVEVIDALIAAGTLPPADLIKIDVEGAEMMVLKGADALLSSHRPLLFVEAHSRELTRECLEYLEIKGYSVTALETGHRPDLGSEPEVCHLVAVHPQQLRESSL